MSKKELEERIRKLEADNRYPNDNRTIDERIRDLEKKTRIKPVFYSGPKIDIDIAVESIRDRTASIEDNLNILLNYLELEVKSNKRIVKKESNE